MLNSYIDIKKQLDEMLLINKENYIKEILTEIYYYVEKVINNIQTDTVKNEELYTLLEGFLSEITNFLTICKKNNGIIDERDIKFSVRIIKELGKELEKQLSIIYQADIIDMNAEMKLLENILKEDGYFEDSNKRRKK